MITPLFDIVGFSIEALHLDVMHVMDLGMSQFLLGFPESGKYSSPLPHASPSPGRCGVYTLHRRAQWWIYFHSRKEWFSGG